jgi:ubiquinone/menaquinone biosynthesis C-methylase UbiE
MIPEAYTRDTLRALEAKEKAQWIAYAPFVFQATRGLLDTGALAVVDAAGPVGLALDEIAQRCRLSTYAARVLTEAALGIGLLTEQDARYRLTKTARFLLHDAMTRANFAFTQDVNYLGLFHLDEALRDGKPAGLKVFGDWPTLYQALAQLPEAVRHSWFRFDHLYSDRAFPAVLPQVFRRAPRRLLDIGGNTGKWALACVAHDPDVHVTIVDLPGQLRDAAAAVQAAGHGARVAFHEADLLDAATALPAGFDAIWMSQFLDCFADAEIVSILRRVAAALGPQARAYVLEPFWDRQRFGASAFSLQMTSLYFTAMANGNSQMYRSEVFLALVRQAGLEVEEQVDGLGLGHTLLVCRRAAP